jgi:hypothetical protein
MFDDKDPSHRLSYSCVFRHASDIDRFWDAASMHNSAKLARVGRADRCIEGMAQIIDLGDLRLDDCRRISQPGIGQNLDRRRTVSRWDLSSQQQIDAVVAEQDTR